MSSGCGSNLISDAFCMVGFNAVLSISKADGASRSITCMFVHSSSVSSIIGFFFNGGTTIGASSSLSESTGDIVFEVASSSSSTSFSSATATGAALASRKSFNLSGETLILNIKKTTTLKIKTIMVPILPA